MKADFWHERWEKGETGFHQQDFNPYMQAFFGRLEVPEAARIFVPLCGKSLDMLWLANLGFRVTGVEISARAASDFFAENGLEHEVVQQASATVYRGLNIDIYCADFFSLGQGDLPRIDAVYDRAALIALPPEMRQAYAQHLDGLIEGGTPILLITMEYLQDEMRGPPFSVTPGEVEKLFSERCSLEQIHSEDCLAREPRFRKKGLTRLNENVFVLYKTAVPGPAGLR